MKWLLFHVHCLWYQSNQCAPALFYHFLQVSLIIIESHSAWIPLYQLHSSSPWTLQTGINVGLKIANIAVNMASFDWFHFYLNVQVISCCYWLCGLALVLILIGWSEFTNGLSERVVTCWPWSGFAFQRFSFRKLFDARAMNSLIPRHLSVSCDGIFTVEELLTLYTSFACNEIR